MNISVKKIEKVFGKKVIPFLSVLGVDTASRTGWARITTDPKQIHIDYSFIDVKTTDKYFKYDEYITVFSSLIRQEDILVIEETYYGRNAQVFQLLSRLGAFVYTIAHLKGVKEKSFILASSARKNLGLQSIAKKEVVQAEFCKKLGLKIEDNDVVDAIILALQPILTTKEKTF